MIYFTSFSTQNCIKNISNHIADFKINKKHKNKSLSLSEEMFYCDIILLPTSVSILGEPGWPLPVPFNDPLALIFFRWCLPRVQHHSLYRRSLQRASFLFSYLLSDCCSLLTHFLIAIATKDVLLFQVATFWTHVYIILNFNKLMRISSPTAINFNAVSVFRSCHPKDTVQKAGILTLTGILWLCKDGWPLYC